MKIKFNSDDQLPLNKTIEIPSLIVRVIILCDRDIYSGDILLDKKTCETYKNILIYEISYKIFMGAKPLRIRFDEIHGLLKLMMELDI